MAAQKQRLILRTFSADPVTNFAWATNGLSSTPPKLRTLAVFTLSSVKLHDDTIELIGRRSTFFQEANAKPALAGDARVALEIALNGADPTRVLPALKSLLFFDSLEAAMMAVPQDYRKILLQPDASKKGDGRPASCPAAAQYERPKVIFAPDPEMSDQARRMRFTGSVETVITVGVDGHPHDLWLRKPADLGLDEKAIKAVSGYVFKPATCNGVPIELAQRIDVNFTMM